ncbi:MAG: oligosaccharide flippase family protein [Planctomycetota bacterium]|jgi:O-antigen/teichoic acid export membrane protein
MKLLASSILISGARLGEKVLSFVIIIIASRAFGSDGVGEFFFYFSLVCLFMPLMDMGFEKLLLQRWWTNDLAGRRQLLTRLLMIKLMSGALALGLAIAVDAVVRWGSANPLAVTAAFLAIYLTEMGELLRRPAHAEGQVRYDIAIPLLSRLLTLGGLLLYVGRIEHGYQIAYVYAAANGIGMLVSLLGMKGTRPTLAPGATRENLLELARAGIPFSLTHFFVMIALYVDSVMIGHFGTMDEVGAYNAAYRVILVLAALSGGACHTLFPRITKLRADGEDERAAATFGSVFNAFLLAFGTCAIGGIIFGPRLMTALYGADFAASGLPFQLLSLIIILSAVTNLIGQTQEALGHQKKVMAVNLRSSLFNVMANLALIPVLGMVGAAITTICTEMIVLIYQLRALREEPAF